MDKKKAIINTEKETRSFFWFMTAILIGLSVFTIVSQAELQSLLSISIISFLMVVHIILHWMIRKFLNKPGWTIAYMLVQGAILVAMILITRSNGVALGLTLALLGEAIGVYGLTKRGLFAALYYFVLSLWFYVWIVGLDQVIWWLIATVPMIVFVVLYVELYSRQVKANERAQELLTELELNNKQLTDYSAQIEDLTISSERQRMARELHDTLSQGLAGLILQLEAVDANLAGGKVDRSRQIILQTMESARKTLADARLAIDDLRQGQMQNCCEAIIKRVDQFTSETDIPCELNIDLPKNLPHPVAETLLAVTSESLANIARHASASQVMVHLWLASDHELELEIKDDGQGFDPRSVPEIGHYGLLGIKERVSLVDGRMEISSQPGQGTTLSIRIPLP